GAVDYNDQPPRVITIEASARRSLAVKDDVPEAIHCRLTKPPELLRGAGYNCVCICKHCEKGRTRTREHNPRYSRSCRRSPFCYRPDAASRRKGELEIEPDSPRSTDSVLNGNTHSGLATGGEDALSAVTDIENRTGINCDAVGR